MTTGRPLEAASTQRPTQILWPSFDGGCGWRTARRRARRAARRAALGQEPWDAVRRFRRLELDGGGSSSPAA